MHLLQFVLPGRRPGMPGTGASGGTGTGGTPGAAPGAEAGGDTRPGRFRLRARRRWAPASGRVFAAVTVTPALLAAAWLVPGTGLLLAGRLLPLSAVLAAGPTALMLCYFAARSQPADWPAPHPAGPRVGVRAGVPAGALVLMVVVAAGFGAWQALLRSEPLFAGGGPQAFLQYGYWIAGHGTVRVPAWAASFGGASGLDFAVPGFSVTGGPLTPAAMPGLPLVLAGGTWLGGLGGALLMPAVLGAAALLSFAGLAGRLCGAWPAVAGELVLGVCLPEVYTTRAPFSEPLVQVLLLGGLCLLVDAQANRGRPGAGRVPAALAGLALGLTVLASAASIAVLVPAVPVLAVLFAARRPQAVPFAAGLLAGAGTGLAAGLVLARPYLAAVSGPLHLAGLCAAGAAAAGVLAAPAVLPRARPRVRRAFAARWEVCWYGGRRTGLPTLGGIAQWTALVLPAVVFVVLSERADLQVVRAAGVPAVTRTVAFLQRLEGLPADGLRRYYESSLFWVAWYLGAPGLLLACVGAAETGRRAVHALLDPRTAGRAAAAARLWGMPLLFTGWSAVTVLWDPAEVPWQPLASRRLVPVILPGLVLLGTWVLSWLTSRVSAAGAPRALAASIGACGLLGLAVPPPVTTLNPTIRAVSAAETSSPGTAGLDLELRLHGAGASAAGSGSLRAMAGLCVAIGPSASVVITGTQAAAEFEQDIREFCGQPAARLAGPPTAAKIQQALHAVRQAGRRPVLLGGTRSSVSAPGAAPGQAVLLRTSTDPQTLAGPPAGNWPVTYSAWLSVPPAG
jgi:hypothetical protein